MEDLYKEPTDGSDPSDEYDDMDRAEPSWFGVIVAATVLMLLALTMLSLAGCGKKKESDKAAADGKAPVCIDGKCSAAKAAADAQKKSLTPPPAGTPPPTGQATQPAPIELQEVKPK